MRGVCSERRRMTWRNRYQVTLLGVFAKLGLSRVIVAKVAYSLTLLAPRHAAAVISFRSCCLVTFF